MNLGDIVRIVGADGARLHAWMVGKHATIVTFVGGANTPVIRLHNTPHRGDVVLTGDAVSLIAPL